jgi:tetratricopeptide (TPR) repeat protein
VSSTLGYAYALSGRSAEAIPLLEEGGERPVIAGSNEGQSLRTLRLSEAYLLAGREADASAAAQRALGLARHHKERGHEAYALRLLGGIVAREDPLDIGKAEDHYRQALALAEKLGMRPLVAHCHVGLGKLYWRSGNLLQAKEHLNKGVAMMREMEMGLWLEKAEAELKKLG